MSPEPFLTIKMTAADDAPFTAMFEPSGMTYELGSGESMFADVHRQFTNEIVIENWQGGISVWAPGAVVTRDGEGKEMDHLN